MTMQRWDPFREVDSLRDMMDRFLEERVGRGRGEMTEGGTHSLPLDIWETEDAVMVQASLPGVRPEDLDIRVEGNILTVRGQTEMMQETKDENFVRRERRFGRFFRQVALPSMVQTDGAEATFENGVVTVRLPKAEQARPRQIPIRGSEQRQQQQEPTPIEGRAEEAA